MEGSKLVAIFSIAVATLFLYLYNILWLAPERLREKLRRQGIKGPHPSPFFGNLLQMKRIQEEATKFRKQQGGKLVPGANYFSVLFPYLDKWTNEYGPLFMYSMGNIQVVHVSRPDVVKEIGQCKSLEFGRPTYMRQERGALFGRGILVSNGASWAHQRKVISAEFFMNKVKGMVTSITEAAIPLLSKWESKIESEGGIVDLVVDEDLRIFSMDLISRACFGSNFLKGKEIFKILRQLQKVMSKASLGIPGLRHLPTKTNREIWRLDQEIRSLILNIAKERKQRPSDSPANDLLQSIIDNAGTGPDPADDFIVDNCKGIYFAGHETTALSATWCLMLLSSNLEWQDRARAEVLDICQGEMPNAGMLGKMKLLTMVIQESLRHYSPASSVLREAFEDTKLGDIIIPKGATVRITLVSLLHDPEIWGPDASEFNPGRFAQGISGACKLPHMYAPFGLGTRTCAGQNFAMVELKIILALLLSRFSFSLSPRYVHSPVYALTTQPEFGVPLILKKLDISE